MMIGGKLEVKNLVSEVSLSRNSLNLPDNVGKRMHVHTQNDRRPTHLLCTEQH